MILVNQLTPEAVRIVNFAENMHKRILVTTDEERKKVIGLFVDICEAEKGRKPRGVREIVSLMLLLFEFRKINHPEECMTSSSLETQVHEEKKRRKK
ncbi:MAG: hypothetical protein LUH22_07860 [Bacteroides sp.]|nr:hypothetical protein [Bacteroides sp.]